VTLLDEGPDVRAWTTACDYDHLIPGRGAGVLLPDGTQAALFRLDDGSLRAIGNVDPFSGAAVMSRGIVGSRGDRATVASPLNKQVYDLETGECLSAEGPALSVFPVRIVAGAVEVGFRSA